MAMTGLRACSGVLVSLAILGMGCSQSDEERRAAKNAEAPVTPITRNAGDAVEAAVEIQVSKKDWPWWRGQDQDNIAKSDAPTEWSESKNLVWKAPVPGRGHASPTVVGSRIFLATANENKDNASQSVVAFSREDGEQLWDTTVHAGDLPTRGMHHESSHASSTVACDGHRAYAVFLNTGAIWVTALEVDGGKQVWQTKVGGYQPQFGFSPSPLIHKEFVIIAADHKGGGWIAALHRDTGKVMWLTPRPAENTYASPLLAQFNGRTQVTIAGAMKIESFDADTGAKLWETEGPAGSCASTMAAWNDLVIASGGYSGAATIAVRPGNSAEIAWKNKLNAYVPSLLVVNDALFLIDNDSRAYCVDPATGKQHWRGRLPSGAMRSSPVAAGGNIYAINTKGVCTVYRASTEKLEVVSENQLGTEMYATPTICGNRIYLRVADGSKGGRCESLYCIGE